MKYYVVDVFADKLFEGNPAGICIMDKWISEDLMEAITAENNLVETVFAVKEGQNYRLQWFTSGGEIDLCGHATLAAAFVLSEFVETTLEQFVFQTLSGQLMVKRKGELFEMDFPGYDLKQIPVTDEMEQAIGIRPIEAWMGRDLVCVFDSESQIYDVQPNQEKVMELDDLLLQITALGTKYDCVTRRKFDPKMAVKDDAVCGSGHCHIILLWAKKLKKNVLVARQASQRGGILYCENCGARVKLSGKAVLYSVADLLAEKL
ncbi:PhzF family phenazine biosynthesis protein [Clostridium tyrobutyricum]|uniref:PhzF family phenazine biosynthesis protein n=1 Tax=Clostridium tyrobutyricum TaxID=1519 RepID=UPI00057DE478|nr:PhzF family phenazine biosynthesis protein [Clostridium tyrobutyricum]